MANPSPPVGWTDREARLHKTYYWADKPDTVRDVLQTTYNLSDIDPVWTCDPDRGEVLFIFKGKNRNNQWRYYLWNGLEDTVAQFVEVTLQNIKNQMGQESLKNVTFRDVE